MDFDDFLKKLKEANLTKEEFTELTGIGDNLLKGWGTQRQGRRTQPWVESWLNLYINNKEKDIAIKILKK
jgi:hypothetical protein